MRVSNHVWLYRNEEVRVIVAGDVVSLPGSAGAPGWSMGGFGRKIDEAWLLNEGKLPGSVARRRVLADMIVRSLRAHYEDVPCNGDGVLQPRGPFVPCPVCNDAANARRVAGWIPRRRGSTEACEGSVAPDERVQQDQPGGAT